MSYMIMTAFDTETTGLEHEKEEIVELGAAKFTFDKVEGRVQPVELACFSQLVNPGRPIPPQISMINNITDAMVKDAPPIASALRDFLQFIAGSHFLVAHNAEFDAAFVGTAIKRSGLDAPKIQVLDTLKIIRKTNPEFRSYKLGNIAKQLAPQMSLKQDPSSAHRAFYDCRVLAHVLTCSLRKRFPAEEFQPTPGIKTLTKYHGKPFSLAGW